MSDTGAIPAFLARLADAHIVVERAPSERLSPARVVTLAAADWGAAGKLAFEASFRHAGIWGDHVDDEIRLFACLVSQGNYLVLACGVPANESGLASHAPYFPGVDRMERHLHDMLGVAFIDHPNATRWTRHQAWPEDVFPLRADFPLDGRAPRRARADNDYPFASVLGSGVYEIPVGPVHAGIIEPGHFRFHAVGEQVLRLEERLGYTHKGAEKLAVGRDAAGLARLANRISGDSAVSHAWAACMAMERAASLQVPPRGQAMRAILAERERIANHLGDIGAICNDVGFAFAHMQFGRLREIWQRGNQTVFDHRLLMDRVVPGGIAADISDEGLRLLQSQCVELSRELDGLMPIIDDLPSLEDRLVMTGVFSEIDARTLGALGYVAKASGIDYDLRRDHGYAPYDALEVKSPCLTDGDVASRVQIRAEELRDSLDLIENLLRQLPEGQVSAPWPEGTAGVDGIGLIEGWRGEILSYVRFDADGRVARFFPRDPSWFNWQALERLIHGNIVPDFPVCNKSINGSYSGHDL